MSKIRLDPMALHVDTFDPAPTAGSARGTVHAHASAYWEMCDVTTTTADPRVDTCGCTDATCEPTRGGHTCYRCEPTSTCPVASLDPLACMAPPVGP